MEFCHPRSNLYSIGVGWDEVWIYMLTGFAVEPDIADRYVSVKITNTSV